MRPRILTSRSHQSSSPGETQSGLHGPDLAWQELSQVFAVRTKLIIRRLAGWLAGTVAAGKKSNSDEWLSTRIILSWLRPWNCDSSVLTSIGLLACWSIRVWHEPPHLSHRLTLLLDRARPSLSSPGWQLTFYSFSLSLYLHTSGFLVSEGSVEICYLGNYKINSSCEIFENPISAASIDWDHLNSWPVLS